MGEVDSLVPIVTCQIFTFGDFLSQQLPKIYFHLQCGRALIIESCFSYLPFTQDSGFLPEKPLVKKKKNFCFLTPVFATHPIRSKEWKG